MRRLVASVAIITRRLSSEAARVNGASSPSPRVPPQRRPHMGGGQKATNANVLLSMSAVCCVGKLRLDRLTPDHHTRPAPAAIGCCPPSRRACATSRRHATPRHSTSPFTSLPIAPTAVLLPPTSTPSLRRCAWESGSLLNGDHILHPASTLHLAALSRRA